MSLSTTILQGRFTATPELKKSAETDALYSRFTLAVDRDFSDDTDFIQCVVFGKTAENLTKYFVKGREIIVTGSLQSSVYEKNGEKKYSTTLKIIKWFFPHGYSHADRPWEWITDCTEDTSVKKKSETKEPLLQQKSSNKFDFNLDDDFSGISDVESVENDLVLESVQSASVKKREKEEIKDFILDSKLDAFFDDFFN